MNIINMVMAHAKTNLNFSMFFLFVSDINSGETKIA